VCVQVSGQDDGLVLVWMLEGGQVKLVAWREAPVEVEDLVDSSGCVDLWLVVCGALFISKH
jgi:hypothetical protein